MTKQDNQLNRIEELIEELLEIQRASTSEAVLERVDRNREVCEDTIPLTSDVLEGIGRKEKKRTIFIEDGVVKEVEVDANKLKEIEDRANSMLHDIPDDAIVLKPLEHRGKTYRELKAESLGCDEWKRIASIAEDYATMSKYATPMTSEGIKLWHGNIQ